MRRPPRRRRLPEQFGADAQVVHDAASTPSSFLAYHQVPAGWDRTESIKADCNSWSPPTTQADDEFAGPGGTTVDLDVGMLTVRFDRHGGVPLRAPVSALVRGGGFTIATGLHTSELTSCEGDCSGTLKIEERYTVKFTPLR